MQYFPVQQLFYPNILEFDNGWIETPRPKLFPSNHCIRRDDARHELQTVTKKVVVYVDLTFCVRQGGLVRIPLLLKFEIAK